MENLRTILRHSATSRFASDDQRNYQRRFRGGLLSASVRKGRTADLRRLRDANGFALGFVSGGSGQQRQRIVRDEMPTASIH